MEHFKGIKGKGRFTVIRKLQYRPMLNLFSGKIPTSSLKNTKKSRYTLEREKVKEQNKELGNYILNSNSYFQVEDFLERHSARY